MAERKPRGCALPCPVAWRGRIFPSIKAAARTIGVRPEAVSKALNKYGSCDHLPRKPGYQPGNPSRPQPIALYGLQFRSQKEAAETLGIGTSTIRKAVNKKCRSAQQTVYAACMRLQIAKAA